MKLRKKLAALLVAATLLLGLTACQKEEPQEEVFDVKTYVEGLLRATYLGEFSQEYLDLVGITEATAQSVYENSLLREAYAFTYLYNIEYPDDLYEELMDIYREIYTHLEFEVVATTRYYKDGSFAVQVDIAPIDIVQKAEARMDEALKPFFEKYPSEAQNAMTTADYKEFDAEWARLILDIYQETLPEIGNLERQSVTVKIEKNEEGYYGISDEEFKKLDALVIDYSEPTPEPTETDPQSPEESPAGDAGENPPEGDPTEDPEGDPPEGDPTEHPGENDPVPPTTASPLPEPEESGEPEGSPPPEESPEGTE